MSLLFSSVPYLGFIKNEKEDYGFIFPHQTLQGYLLVKFCKFYENICHNHK